MKLRRETRDNLIAWTALFTGAFAWFGSQQLGSNWVIAGCSPGDGLFAFVISLIALALIVAGGFCSLNVWRGGDDEAPRSFVALVGILTSGLLAVAIILQGAAGLIIPSCFG
ncbi:MAG: hypothetical protein QOG84_1026 [Sphingomonadales bacterium]|jgi:hypothetical protein|nr:hypothetical protein [Sphingomonadales bacterium]